MKKIVILLNLFLCIFSVSASAESYPSKPITIIVGLSAGGTTDIFTRFIAAKMQEKLKVQVNVLNKPGANGILAMQEAKKASPDGYTFYMLTTNHVVNHNIYSDKYNPTEDFSIIGPYVIVPNLLVTMKTSKAPSFEAIKNSKKENEFTYAASTIGGAPYIAMMKIQEALKKKYLYVAYKGAGNSYSDFLGGHIDFAMYTLPSGLTVLENANVVPLAITSSTRFAGLPNVPTMSELGFKKFESNAFYGLAGPKGIDKNIVIKMNTLINEILSSADESTQKITTGLGLSYVKSNPSEFLKFLVKTEKNLKPFAIQIKNEIKE